MNTTRFKVATAAAAVATLFLSACGADSGSSAEVAGSWDEILTAANEEGEVLIYSTHAPDNLEALKKAFEKKYPKIKMTYVRGTDADILPKVEVEKQTGKGAADVHMTTDAGWIDRSLQDDSWSQEVVGPSFENETYDPEGSIMEDKWFLTSATVFGMAWNTKKYPAGLEKPEDVLDPKLKGKVGISNPSGIPTYVDMYQRFERDWADGFLPDLAANEPRVYQSAVAIGQAIGSGEVWATPTAATTVLADKASGAPIEFVVPEKPFGVPWYSHVLGTSPHPNAAQVLADFLVTEEGQEAISANYIAALPDVEGTGVPGAEVLAQDIDLPDPSDLEQDKVSAYQKKWEEMFLG